MKAVRRKSEHDRAVVLDVVRRFGPVSRVDVHALTHLRPGTISLIVRELIREGWLKEAGSSDNPTGRKRVLLRINEERGNVVALAFDPGCIEASVVDLGGRLRHLVREPACLEQGADGLVAQLLRLAERAVEESGIDPDSLAGVGVADPGLINAREGISMLATAFDFWRDVPLRSHFTGRFRAPFLLESDTRARMFAERILGAGRNADDMLYVDYSTGIGLGVVTGGRILRGSNGCAGEFGHTRIMDGGPPCKCGSFGCLETLAGAPALAARARRALAEGAPSRVLELAGGDPGKITGFLVMEAARNGDKMCGAILEETGRWLALGIANAVNLFNPSLVVLDGRLKAAGQRFLEQVTQIVKWQALSLSTHGLELRFGELGPEAGVLGVALMVIQGLFEIPALKLPRFMIEPAREPVPVGK
jgi:predicted NBD/HSP70 family sugar kinase